MISNNYVQINKNYLMCHNQCKVFDKSESECESVEQQVEFDLKLDECRNECRRVDKEIKARVEAETLNEISTFMK